MSVYLVGAGSGDVELLTLKALKILKIADVILYDALINDDILSYCKSDAIKMCVGKRKGHHLLPQQYINDELLKYAQGYDIVVRLKGGTPFVFGRGYEEVRHLRQNGIEPIIISGVSSTTSVPEYFMIPLIDRAYSDSYRTITGHCLDTFASIVTSYHNRENLIILMGAHNAKEIVSILLSQKEYPLDTPIAFLSNGYGTNAQKIVSSLDEVSRMDDEFFDILKRMTPLIIYIGDTIRCSL